MSEIKLQIDKIIQRDGIPYYLKKWNPSSLENYNLDSLNRYVKKYHSHASINFNNSNKNKEDEKLPIIHFYEKDKILYFKFFHYYLDYLH